MSEIKKIAYKIFVANTQYEGHDIFQTIPIHKGYTNISYLFKTLDKKWFQVRIANDNHVVNRKNELSILKAINDKNYLYYDLKTGNAIKKWIVGENPSQKILRSSWFLKALSNEIKRLHKTDIKNNTILKHDYLEFISENNLNKFHRELYVTIYAKYQDLPQVLSHNDINCDNIIICDYNVTLIDYEWGRLNNEYWDLANFVRECDFNNKLVSKLLKYNKHLNKKIFYDFIYLCTNYAYQWSFCMPRTQKMVNYQKKTLEQLEKYYQRYIKN